MRREGGELADIHHYSEPLPRLKTQLVAEGEAMPKNTLFQSDKVHKLLILSLAG